MQKYRYWSITWFKEDLDEKTLTDPIPHKEDWIDFNIVYSVYQMERCPSTNRLHLQMYVQFKNTVRMATIQAVFKGCHAESCRANEKSNVRYCSKEASRIAGPWTYGKSVTEGKRTDWTTVKEMISEGCNRKEIISQVPHLAPNLRAIDEMIDMFQPEVPNERDVRVYFLWGPSNTGKTHRARTRFPKAFKISGRYQDGKSFDGYLGQEELIIDEFMWEEWPLTLMNNLLDKWSFELTCRYRNKQANWRTVVICSNQDPAKAYPGETYKRAAFMRRLTHILQVNSQDDQIDF